MRLDLREIRIPVIVAASVVVAMIAGAFWWVGSSDSSGLRTVEEPSSRWSTRWTEARAETPKPSSERGPREIRESSDGDEDASEPSPRPRDRRRDRPRQRMPGQQRGESEKPQEYDPAVLRVVTNFEKADVTVNGLPYPEYKEKNEEQPGMVLPAGGPYKVQVTYNGKKKIYKLSLRPYEVRYLMVDLTGFKGGAPAPAPDPEPQPRSNQSNNDDGTKPTGRVTVYSKPKGQIRVNGDPKEQTTPGTVEVEAGQHNIQVKFEGGSISESKTVRVRKGSRIKLFFRKND